MTRQPVLLTLTVPHTHATMERVPVVLVRHRDHTVMGILVEKIVIVSLIPV